MKKESKIKKVQEAMIIGEVGKLILAEVDKSLEKSKKKHKSNLQLLQKEMKKKQFNQRY